MRIGRVRTEKEALWAFGLEVKGKEARRTLSVYKRWKSAEKPRGDEDKDI